MKNIEIDDPFYKRGRNAPCLCGSGKKYKKCCLHHLDQTIESENVLTQEVINRLNSLIDPEESAIRPLSDIIFEYAEELLDDVTTPLEMEGFVLLATAAWNLSFVDKDNRI